VTDSAAAAEAAPTERATDAAGRVRRGSRYSPPTDREMLPLGLAWSLTPRASRVAAPVLKRNLRIFGKARPWVLKLRPRARTSRPTPLSRILFSSASCRTELKARLASRMRFANSCSSSHFSWDACIRDWRWSTRSSPSRFPLSRTWTARLYVSCREA